VQYYVYLQKIRFRDRFNVVWDIAKSIENYMIIKLVLQPIIENAIIHGVESMESGGLIEVRGYEDDGTLFLEVEDNGIGMSEEVLREFEAHINNAQTRTDTSVGLKNVHQRIRLYFGDAYGISIFSKENEGTRVVLNLPVIAKHRDKTQW
jgi:two-component system sensor histidine kinase YesM